MPFPQLYNTSTFKNQLIILPEAQDIVDVIVGKPGSSSDINLLREQQKKFAAHQQFKGDKGYIGEERVATPHKKPKNRELSETQKQENKVFMLCGLRGANRFLRIISVELKLLVQV